MVRIEDNCCSCAAPLYPCMGDSCPNSNGVFKNLSGKKFGRLNVTNEYTKRRDRNGMVRIYWKCICDCGNEEYANTSALLGGHKQSCGCLQREAARKAKTKYGISRSRIYKILTGMRQRCENPNNSAWEHYGGRGIKVCSEWDNAKDGAINFYNWSMQNGYKDELTIERIDVNGNYCPENCMWVTWKEQHLNTRNTLKVTYNGEIMPLKTACNLTGVNYFTAVTRMKKGLSDEEVLRKVK